MGLQRILYRIVISGRLTKDEIERIVNHARIKNEKIGISGVLMAIDDCVM